MRLEFIVFVCGAVVMVLEIVGSRLLAPYLGTSVYVWTSLIGIILGALSLGYAWGGRLADRGASYKTLSGVIFAAACLVTLLVYIHFPLLLFLRRAVPDLRAAAVIAAIVLFAPPSVLLGIVSPYAIRLKIQSLENSGRTIGRLYAISTFGSIVGTFLAGFVLLSLLGTIKILLSLATTLFIVSLVALWDRKEVAKMNALPAFLFFLGIAWAYSVTAKRPGIVDVDTQYSRLRIADSVTLDTNTPVRVLMNEPFCIQGLVGLDSAGNPERSAGPLYTTALVFRLGNHFRPAPSRALMIGGGVFVVPVDFLERNPQATIDVVEIDPALTGLSEKYFGLVPDPRLRIINEDGRTFINRNTEKYDIIFVDAFGTTLPPPFQLTTKEWVSRLHDSLNDGGVVLVNVVSGIEGHYGQLARAFYRTYRTSFPHVGFFQFHEEDASEVHNVMLVARKSDVPLELTSTNEEHAKRLALAWKKEIPADMPVLTDDFAPVEHYLRVPKLRPLIDKEAVKAPAA